MSFVCDFVVFDAYACLFKCIGEEFALFERYQSILFSMSDKERGICGIDMCDGVGQLCNAPVVWVWVGFVVVIASQVAYPFW